MAAIIWTDVTALAAELSTVSVGWQTDVLAFVNGDGLDEDQFGGEASITTRMARIFMAAHLGACAGAGATAGPIQSESAGGLSRSYAVMATSGEGLATTEYGRQYRAMIKRKLAGPWMVNG